MKSFPQKLRKNFTQFRPLSTPEKIQNFLDGFPINFSEYTHSPLLSLSKKKIHCLDGALLGASILWYHGKSPLLLDLKTNGKDDDHIVALFKENGCWGALSKTNHATLRYRDPIYKTIRELVMSYFNEYFLDSGEKVLVSYSKPFSLSSLPIDWLTSKENLDWIGEKIDTSPHIPVIKRKIKLRRVGKLERTMGKLREWKK